MPKRKKRVQKHKEYISDENFNQNQNNIKLFCAVIFIIVNLSIKNRFETITENKYEEKIDKKFITNFNYTDCETFFITDEMKRDAGWMNMNSNQYYLINGIIRKHKPKSCLEVGVAEGGSSIIILNAIKDIKNSSLISLDLNTNFYLNPSHKTGYRVEKYFPELTKNWQLFTGEQPHIFLEKLNLTYDFVFLDTAHINPGELINFIEILPFLNENAIIVLHDIVWHLIKENERQKERINSISSPSLLLMSTLYGDKIVIKTEDGLENMGAIYLYKNQKEHYLNYFLLLLNFWEYMPSEKHLEEIRVFIKKYYDNDLYLSIFETAVKNNKNYVTKLKNSLK